MHSLMSQIKPTDLNVKNINNNNYNYNMSKSNTNKSNSTYKLEQLRPIS